ncbi:unnamed protein product, partial [Symbiodinium sp. KB8]
LLTQQAPAGTSDSTHDLAFPFERVASPVPLKATMARRPDDTRGSLIFQEGKCIEGLPPKAVEPAPSTPNPFSAYELENDCTYTYPLTYSQFDALFQYDSELMNPSNQDG